MGFKEVVSIIQSKISETSGIEYDGIMIKRLEASNTLDEGRSTNQTHIAITGDQMNMFPYLMADGYFNCDYQERDEDLKKYFVTQIPFRLYKSNVDLLDVDDKNPVSFDERNTKDVLVSVLRSRRNGAADQVQLSLTRMDDQEFIGFRKLLHAGSYLILLKQKEKFIYDCFGISSSDEFISELEPYNNKFFKTTTSTAVDISKLVVDSKESDERITGGCNLLFYGVPGAGKSHEIDSRVDQERTERVVFHPDYTYSDFIGQILPRLVKAEGESEAKLRYVFEAGPFTRMVKEATNNPNHMYYLVVEEINRGNAPAIFGDIFQLLDRDDKGASKYKISNYDMATEIFGDENESVRIPSNLTLMATMNTSDQNVFTLDTAFQRRWEMHLIQNNVRNAEHAEQVIGGSNVKWGDFASVTNDAILRFAEETGSAEDKRLGAYFVKLNELTSEKFPEKVLKYLWDDAFKMDRHVFFNEGVTSLDMIIETYKTEASTDRLKGILQSGIYKKMMGENVQTDLASNEEEKGDGQ